MDKNDCFQASTLWFAAMVFLQTSSGDGGGLALGIAAVAALAVTYLVPLYLLVGVAAAVVGEIPASGTSK